MLTGFMFTTYNNVKSRTESALKIERNLNLINSSDGLTSFPCGRRGSSTHRRRRQGVRPAARVLLAAEDSGQDEDRGGEPGAVRRLPLAGQRSAGVNWGQLGSTEVIRGQRSDDALSNKVTFILVKYGMWSSGANEVE